MGTSVNDDVRSKTPGIKHPGNLGQDRKTKYKNNTRINTSQKGLDRYPTNSKRPARQTGRKAHITKQ